MPIHILEESEVVSRLNRNHKVKRSVHYIELTHDITQEKVDVRLYHEGSLHHILACYKLHIESEAAPLDFKYAVTGPVITFFSDNEYALNFLRKIGAISLATYELAIFCLHPELCTPSSPLRP
jgi:hypothetical protein